MGTISTEEIRTLALVGHAGSGKTTLAEALLHQAGAIEAPGTIQRGSTVCDFDPLEKAHQHSLYSAIAHFNHGGARVHLIDTPGYPDFLGPAISALEAVETAVIVVNAQTGIELTTTRMMAWAQKRGLCRLLVINKIDAGTWACPAQLEQIRAPSARNACRSTCPPAAAPRWWTASSRPAERRIFLRWPTPIGR
jgi:elongation factor G